MNDIRSFQNLILNYSNFIHASTSSIHDQSRSSRFNWIILPVRCPSLRVHLESSVAWLEDDKQWSRRIDDCEAASAISRRIFLPWSLNAWFNLHLYCINSKERLRDKREKGIDDGRSTIKSDKNSNGRSDIGRSSLSPSPIF